MDDYSTLKPGLYLKAGNNVKSIVTIEDLLIGYGANPSAEQLAGEVAWLWIAINKRRSHILEVPYTWQLRENEQEDTPYGMPFTELLQQTDEAMQLYGTAYWLKQRGGGRRVLGVRWLDPTSIEPDYETADVMKGVMRFKRHLDNGLSEWLDAADVIWFKLPGLREMRPGVAAGKASRVAADILRGMQQATETLYDNNALPVMLIKVPPSTGDVEINRLQNAFRRLFNPGKGSREYRTQGVRADIEVMPLSMNPKDLEQGETFDRQRDTILSAHDVPKSIAMSDASNYATAISDMRQFIGVLGGRVNYVADVCNDDADLVRDGWYLDVQTDNHWSMKEDEAQRAGAFSQYVTGGFTAEAAAYLLGISRDDFPDDMIIFEDDKPKEEPPPQLVMAPPQPVAQEPIADERQENEIRRLRSFVRNGKHLKRPFTSDVLTQAQIADIIEEETDNDMQARFDAALARFNKAIE